MASLPQNARQRHPGNDTAPLSLVDGRLALHAFLNTLTTVLPSY